MRRTALLLLPWVRAPLLMPAGGTWGKRQQLTTANDLFPPATRDQRSPGGPRGSLLSHSSSKRRHGNRDAPQPIFSSARRALRQPG